MNIGILFGGKSGEHEVSLVSAASVARHIDTEKHTVTLIGITKDNRWYLQPATEFERIKNDDKAVFQIVKDEANLVSVVSGGKKDAFTAGGKSLGIDIIIPALHGTYCEDGILQGLLEMADVPYVGCGVMSGSLSMDKEMTKEIWAYNGLPVVPYICMTRTELSDSRKYDQVFTDAIENLGLPLFVKPCNAGSSVGATKAHSAKELSMALMEAFMWDNKVLIEKAVNAREVECSVTGNSCIESGEVPESMVKAYEPGEILPSHEFYDYDAKYNDPEGAALKIPADLTDEMRAKIKETAEKAYRAVNASGLSRVDFFVDKDSGEYYLNEINTLPGFTSISMFPKMCEASGLKYADLIEMLLTQAVQRYQTKEQLQTSR